MILVHAFVNYLKEAQTTLFFLLLLATDQTRAFFQIAGISRAVREKEE